MLLGWVSVSFVACTSFGTAPGAVTDAGTSDASSSDAALEDGRATDGRASACLAPGNDVVFCQDFESLGMTSPFGFDRFFPDGIAPPSLVVEDENRVLELRYSDGIDLKAGPGVVLRRRLTADAGYELSFRFKVVENECAYAVLGGLFSTFGPDANGGVTAGPTLCNDGSKLSGKDCVTTQPLTPGWHSSKTVVSPPQSGLTRRVELSVDGQPNIAKDMEGDPSGTRTSLALLIGPHYPSTESGCPNLVVRYDDIVLRRVN
jgi:hypothetical protein